MKVKIKKLRCNAIIPTKGSEKSAGYDLYACMNEPVFINPHETKMISTGLLMELPDGTFGAIVARSGIATKRGLAPANKIGMQKYIYKFLICLKNKNNRRVQKLFKQNLYNNILMPSQMKPTCKSKIMSEIENWKAVRC